MRHISQYDMNERDKVIIVDGCKGNNNVTDLIGDEVAVIDHHEVSAPEDVPYSDIRSECGACATIIFSYFRELDIPVPRDAATAMMVGITMDTMHFIRNARQGDLDAYAALYPTADVAFVNTIARNDITYPDLRYYEYAFRHLEIMNRFGFVYFPGGCAKNLLGIISDFILALDEVDFVVLCARDDGAVHFSVRSERRDWDASVIIRNALKGIGFGGGHTDMAGGVIKDASLFDKERVFTAFKNLLFS
jgi:nanoRNase/pAp phosphatase (c-di-AMP/oligoRNAs hydrolase)